MELYATREKTTGDSLYGCNNEVISNFIMKFEKEREKKIIYIKKNSNLI